MNPASFAALACLLAAGCGESRVSAMPAVSTQDVAWDGNPSSILSSRSRPKVSLRGMVVADDAQAAEWGAEILRRGGNAVDAAVATAFGMAVTRPYFASLGGGGFFLYCPRPAQGHAQPCHALDYRETAPARATRDRYIQNGRPNTDLSQNGALASGVPGVTAGLLEALKEWGSLPRGKLLQRPIEWARHGVRLTGYGEATLIERWPHLNLEAKRIFGCGKERRPCPAGSLIRQGDLAKVLREIARRGAPGFYRGWVAKKITSGVTQAGGVFLLQDLESYRPKMRVPVSATFQEREIVSMPPPSSGGAIVLQLLKYMQLATDQLSEGPGSMASVHAIAHAMGLAFADRARYFGDPDFAEVPLAGFLSDSYLRSRWASFDPRHAHLPEGPGELPQDHPQTTHFSVIDRDGNAVSVTTTVNDNYGSGFIPPGTGIVMNNEMDDFSIQPGTPNLFGLVGAEANAIAPGKRPLSSMSPVIARDAGGNARIVLGAAGGPRIISSVFLTLLNRLRFGMSLPDAVAYPRIHEQWKPQDLKFERFGYSPEAVKELQGMGYSMIPSPVSLARVYGLERFPNGRVWGAADPRGEGEAAVEWEQK